MFSPEWLSLREPADTAARSEALTGALVDALPGGRAVRILDLGSGTGANARYLFPRLRTGQEWLLADNDAALLSLVGDRLTSADGRTFQVATRRADLSILDDENLFRNRQLVTASALLDLVSESWLRLLAARCREAGAIALFTLTYDGRSSCDPVEPEDDIVRELMNVHQKTDKGLGGRAEGPDAWSVAERVFTEAGFRVECAPSNWSIGPPERTFQRMLIEGWARAAVEIAPERADTIADWLRRRLEHLEAGQSRIVVNHVDMVAW